MDFTDFDLHPDLLDGIEALNFKAPTPIQAQAIPLILEGKDIIGVAQTGTGKTAAFVLPVLNMILDSGESNYTQALIIVPTRELAVQIDQVIEAYSYFTGVSSIAVYGGGDGKTFDRETQAIRSGVDIVIATPGRLLAHMQLGYVNFKRLRFLVLDEADRMLDMGFQPDLLRIIETLNPNRQGLLFSATMAPPVLKLAKTLLREPEFVKIALSKPAENVTQHVYLVHDSQKLALITDLLRDKQGQRILIFCSSKLAVNSLYRGLKAKHLHVAQISSDLEQTEREQVMQDFRNRKVDVLVATDVVSRGIDVDGIELVVNYDVPREPEDYVHRIGRTARAERKGAAITLVSPLDMKRFVQIERLIGKEIERIPLPEGFSEMGSNAPRERGRGERSGQQGRYRNENPRQNRSSENSPETGNNAPREQRQRSERSGQPERSRQENSGQAKRRRPENQQQQPRQNAENQNRPPRPQTENAAEGDKSQLSKSQKRRRARNRNRNAAQEGENPMVREERGNARQESAPKTPHRPRTGHSEKDNRNIAVQTKIEPEKKEKQPPQGEAKSGFLGRIASSFRKLLD